MTIVNVSAVEGKFSYANKQPEHPHTNMAKAALNMLTRTAALGLDGEGIFVNSVDTGWIFNEQPADGVARMHAAGFAPPLDEIDGAARVVDPIFVGARSGRAPSGRFLKASCPRPCDRRGAASANCAAAGAARVCSARAVGGARSRLKPTRLDSFCAHAAGVSHEEDRRNVHRPL